VRAFTLTVSFLRIDEGKERGEKGGEEYHATSFTSKALFADHRKSGERKLLPGLRSGGGSSSQGEPSVSNETETTERRGGAPLLPHKKAKPSLGRHRKKQGGVADLTCFILKLVHTP